MAKEENKMEKIISLCKRRGFIYPGSEIYNGLAGTFDHGPLGVALRNNIKTLWWKRFVDEREDMFGMDAAILMNQEVWKASGHVGGFSDPLVDCNNCKNRFRADHLLEKNADYLKYLSEWIKYGKTYLIDDQDFIDTQSIIEYGKSTSDEKQFNEVENRLNLMTQKNVSGHYIFDLIENAEKYLGIIPQTFLNHKIDCLNCGKRNWNTPRQFNMMFKTHVGATEDESAVSYLRPETAQGMFVNFKNIIDSFHPKLPFGMAQIGKAFRNEISPGNFIFRLRELEQMEMEYFVDPRDEKGVNDIFEKFYNEQIEFLKALGLTESKLHKIEVPDGDRAHYSKRSIDTEFDFPFGQKELLGLAYRTDFDLKAHQKASGADLTYFDEETKERFTPHCIEPTFGVDRLMLAILSDAHREDEMNGETREYLALSKNVAPVRVAVFPLLKNRPELVTKAREVFMNLKKEFGNVMYDESGTIGKRYRRQDEIGTPFCVTIDFDTLENNTVTVRDRDSGEQKRVEIENLAKHLS